jgi:uncharacterized protein
MFKNIIKTKNELRSIISGPSEMVMAKEIDFLDAHCQALIVRSPFILLATANQAGRCDVSPKGDKAGFVQVINKKYLAIPDRPGNHRLDSIENILENPHIGLLFVIPGTRETLRINGQAWIVQDDDILEKATVDGKRPTLAIGVKVQEAFIHCAKAFIRSNLWKPETWPDLKDLPSFAKMLIDHVNAKEVKTTLTEHVLDEALERDYKTELY